MQLAELLKDWPCTVKGSIRTEIEGIQQEIQAVVPGNLFLAIKGKSFDGERCIEEAVLRGASAIVVENELLMYEANEEVPIVWVPNIQLFAAYAYATFAGHPSEALKIVAITGTNGKTTVSHFIGQILHNLQQHVIVIGTNGAFLNGEPLQQFQSGLTTWQPSQLQKIFQFAVAQRIPYVVMEASSMGLATHRLAYVDIDIGVFLNLSKDHIEDHETIEKYRAAKQKLGVLAKQLVLNGDDPFCRSIHMISKKKKVFFAMMHRADFEWQTVQQTPYVTSALIQNKEQEVIFSFPFTGMFQYQNALAAITTVCQLGYDLSDIESAVATLQLPEGRMQRIANELGIDVIIDYAHTEEALKQVLQSIVAFTTGRVIVVFSCGGERDVQKRKLMGEVASEFADLIILTTDNPRSEQPNVINDQIREGFDKDQQWKQVLDRKKAIHVALELAQEGDVVLIAGKGHERTQQIGATVMPFSDFEVVEQFLSAAHNDEERSCGSS